MSKYGEQTDSEDYAYTLNSGEETTPKITAMAKNNRNISQKKPIKKVKLDKVIKKINNINCLWGLMSYHEKLKRISVASIDEVKLSVNTLSIRGTNDRHVWKYPSSGGTDYWVVQHYRIADIKDKAPKDRWKYAQCSLKLETDERSPKDSEITNHLQQTIGTILERFNSDPKKDVKKYKNDEN